ncbi:MAG: cytidine deaminase [Clostridium sp.]|jgi:homotetrameric cytidine deaminase|nr:cytidine deaminase [Clostridium sp.]
MTDRELIQAAIDARKKAYAPYSRYLVGAALLAGNGCVYTGCNVENASYGATCCAERTALFKAVSEGQTSFRAIAVVGGADGEDPPAYAYPCGICRQVLREFAAGDFRVLTARSADEFREHSLAELLPAAFGLGRSESGRECG